MAIDNSDVLRDYVAEYIEAVETGELIVPETIKKLIDRHLRDLESGVYVYDLKEPDRVIRFMELLPDLTTGKPQKLARFQKFIIALMYGWRRKDGSRRFREVFITMSRKQGKSSLISGVGLFEMIYSKSPAMDRQIYCAANTSQQARIVYRMLSKQLNYMMRKSKYIRRNAKVTQNEISFRMGEGIIKPLSSNTEALDGLNVLVGILDEVAYLPVNSEMYSVLKTSQAQQVEPLLFKISTAGTNLNSDMYITDLPYARDVLDGLNTGDAADAFLPIIYEQDTREELEKPETWIKSNPLLEVDEMRGRLMPYLKSQLEQAIATQDTKVLTKNFNYWIANTKEAFVNMEKWLENGVKKDEIPDLRGRNVYIGLDLSARGDLSSISWGVPIEELQKIYCDSFSIVGFTGTIKEKIKNEKVDYVTLEKAGYCKITTKESGYIDYNDVIEKIENLIVENDFNLCGIFYDPYAVQPVITQLESVYGDLLIETRQGIKTLSSPIQKIRQDIEDGILIHANNPLLTRAFGNAELIERHNTLMIDKKNGAYHLKIDPAAALLNAYTELQFVDFMPEEDINEYLTSTDFSIGL